MDGWRSRINEKEIKEDDLIMITEKQTQNIVKGFLKMKKLTKRKLKSFIKDEMMATREYHKYGLHNLEKDERKHHEFLKKLL